MIKFKKFIFSKIMLSYCTIYFNFNFQISPVIIMLFIELEWELHYEYNR